MLVVVATRVEIAVVVDRSKWPAHVTLAGNFRVDDAYADAVSSQCVSAANDAVAFDVSLGPTALFGFAQNIPVLLAEHPAFHRLHKSLSAGLKQLPGFTVVEPSFWGNGYHPHVTLGPAVSVGEGEALSIRWLTLVSLQEHTVQRVSAVQLR